MTSERASARGQAQGSGGVGTTLNYAPVCGAGPPMRQLWPAAQLRNAKDTERPIGEARGSAGDGAVAPRSRPPGLRGPLCTRAGRRARPPAGPEPECAWNRGSGRSKGPSAASAPGSAGRPGAVVLVAPRPHPPPSAHLRVTPSEHLGPKHGDRRLRLRVRTQPPPGVGRLEPDALDAAGTRLAPGGLQKARHTQPPARSLLHKAAFSRLAESCFVYFM